jgi:hypothetical protein
MWWCLVMGNELTINASQNKHQNAKGVTKPHCDFNSIFEHHATKGYRKQTTKEIRQNQKK